MRRDMPLSVYLIHAVIMLSLVGGSGLQLCSAAAPPPPAPPVIPDGSYYVGLYQQTQSQIWDWAWNLPFIASSSLVNLESDGTLTAEYDGVPVGSAVYVSAVSVVIETLQATWYDEEYDLLYTVEQTVLLDAGTITRPDGQSVAVLANILRTTFSVAEYPEYTTTFEAIGPSRVVDDVATAMEQVNAFATWTIGGGEHPCDVEAISDDCVCICEAVKLGCEYYCHSLFEAAVISCMVGLGFGVFGCTAICSPAIATFPLWAGCMKTCFGTLAKASLECFGGAKLLHEACLYKCDDDYFDCLQDYDCLP